MARKVIQVSSSYGVNGEKKWRNANVGSAFVRENGEISLQIDPGISIASLDNVRITIRDPLPKREGGGGY